MLELDAAGIVHVSEAGIEIERAPEGIRFERLEDHPRLGELVGTDEKFAAHNAALWKNGLLVHVPKGVVLEKPLYVRITNTIEGGALFWRLLVVADPESRFTLIEEYASQAPELSAYTNAAVELFVGQASKLEYVSIQNLSRETWHFASHHARVERDAELDWVAGGFGTRKGKIRIQNDLAGQGATSRVTGAYFADGDQHLDYDTFQEHMAPNTTSDFAFKGALRDNATAVWRGHDPGRARRAEDECLPGEQEPPPLSERARRLDPGPRDHGERRPLYPRRHDRPGRPRAAVLSDEPRAFAERGRAHHRPGLLCGHP